MAEDITGTLLILAEAFRYPSPGHLDMLEQRVRLLTDSREKESLRSFLAEIRPLSLGAWEELHTRTLDLNPPAAPYIGFQTWGESYQRGQFLSNLNGALLRAGIDTDGELPDHLVPVFRYLALSSDPLPELLDILDPALQRMAGALRQVDAKNPYLFLIEAAQSACKWMKKEPV